jgi:hypothetical protein
MTTPTPPHDLRSNDAPASPGRFTNARPRGRRAATRPHGSTAAAALARSGATRQYSGDRIVSHLRQAAQAHAAKVRVVLSDEQYNRRDDAPRRW